MPETEVQAWLSGYKLPPAARAVRARPSQLLIVDDDMFIREWLTALADASGWQVRTAASAEEALIKVDQSIPDIVILDQQMPGMTGAESVPHLRDHGVEGPILLFTRFLNEAFPGIRVPLDVWPVSKDNTDGLFELLDSYRTSANTAEPSNSRGARQSHEDCRLDQLAHAASRRAAGVVSGVSGHVL